VHLSPNHPSDGPAYILPSPLPSPPRLEKRPPTPPPAPSRKRSAPDDEIAEVEPLAKRVKTSTNGTTTLPVIASPSKRRKLEEDGLLMLSSKDDKIDDDVIEID
jgi:ubiquitin-like 1-activating enzyme E1 B